MTERDWHNGLQSLGVFLNGMGIQGLDARGGRIVDQSFYLIFNPSAEAVMFTLPTSDWLTHWEAVFDTAAHPPAAAGRHVDAGAELAVEARSVVVLRHAA
jgi:glycogen operon protein